MAPLSFPSPPHSPPTARQPITDGLKRTGPYSFCNSICFSFFSFVSSPLSSFLPHTLSLSFALSLFIFSFSLSSLVVFSSSSSSLLLHSLLCFVIFVLIFSIHPGYSITSRGQSSFLYLPLLSSLDYITPLLYTPQLSVPGGRLPTNPDSQRERFLAVLGMFGSC